MTYIGILPNGDEIQSLYPRVYRVRYVLCFSERQYNIDKLVTAYDEDHVRARCMSPHSYIRGAIHVEHVQDLNERSRHDSPDC
jgi:hypothetical protein